MYPKFPKFPKLHKVTQSYTKLHKVTQSTANSLMGYDQNQTHGTTNTLNRKPLWKRQNPHSPQWTRRTQWPQWKTVNVKTFLKTSRQHQNPPQCTQSSQSYTKYGKQLNGLRPKPNPWHNKHSQQKTFMETPKPTFTTMDTKDTMATMENSKRQNVP
jgi:hypothetical protein